MSGYHQQGDDRQTHDVPLLHGPQSEEEQAREAKDEFLRKAQVERDARDERQVQLSEAQLKTAQQQHHTNIWIVVFTGLLMLISVTGNVISWTSANAARSAAETAKATLDQMKQGGNLATEQMWRGISNLNWEARSIDNTSSTARSAMEKSNKQSRAALDASIRASTDELRPYVYIGINELLGEVAEGSAIVGHGEAINSGRTPAINVRVCSDIAVLGNGNILGDDFPCPYPNNPSPIGVTLRSIGVIGPSNPPMIIESRPTTMYSGSSKPALKTVIDGDLLRIYFYGDVTYNELLRKDVTHHTQFCGVYSPASKHLLGCGHHNNVD